VLGVIAYAIISAVLLVGDIVEIPVAGWEQPLRCLPLIGLCMLIAMLAIVGWIDARESRTTPAPSQQAA
jgi:hypothetical protein